MIYAATVVVLFVVAAGAYIAGVYLDPRWLTQAHRRRILVHTVDGRTIEGVLLETDRESVVLTDAKYRERQTSTAMAGDVWVPRSQIRFIQSIPKDAACNS